MKKQEFLFDERLTGSVVIDHVSKFYGENKDIVALNNL